jgi:xanthine dehydrogenase accessory factor
MYEIALSVQSCLRANTAVSVAWVVDTEGLGEVDLTNALALTPGGGRVGSLLAGAVDGQLVENPIGGTGRLVDLQVSDVDALIAGLPSGGHVRCLLVPADRLPGELWDRLVEREPLCLVTRVEDGNVGATTLFTRETIHDAPEAAAVMFTRGVSNTAVGAEAVVTVLWPVPTLVVVGGGAIADALAAMAGLLGWHSRVVGGIDDATAVITRLAGIDSLVVMGHEPEDAGPALMAGLASRVGYLGGLGGHRVQQARAEWLAERGITDVSRVHGPAGLDIGAITPAEIALSILAEAVATHSTP